MGAIEQEILTQRIEQRLARLDLRGAVGAIDMQFDFHRAPPRDFPAASARACPSARTPSAMATLRRYAALACRSLLASSSRQAAWSASDTDAVSSFVPWREDTSSRSGRSPTP